MVGGLNRDLNQGAGEKNIFLCYSINPWLVHGMDQGSVTLHWKKILHSTSRRIRSCSMD